jgi:hypothetical protein
MSCWVNGWSALLFTFVLLMNWWVGVTDRASFLNKNYSIVSPREAVHLCKEFLWPLTGILLQGSE